MRTLNTIFASAVALVLIGGVSGCEKKTDTQEQTTTQVQPTQPPAPAPTPAPTSQSSGSHSSGSGTSSSNTPPKVVVVPEQQKSNTAGEAAAVHRAVAAPVRRAIGVMKYNDNNP